MITPRLPLLRQLTAPIRYCWAATHAHWQAAAGAAIYAPKIHAGASARHVSQSIMISRPRLEPSRPDSPFRTIDTMTKRHRLYILVNMWGWSCTRMRQLASATRADCNAHTCGNVSCRQCVSALDRGHGIHIVVIQIPNCNEKVIENECMTLLISCKLAAARVSQRLVCMCARFVCVHCFGGRTLPTPSQATEVHHKHSERMDVLRRQQ